MKKQLSHHANSVFVLTAGSVTSVNQDDWRSKHYGKLRGGELEAILTTFGQFWSERRELFDTSDPEKWSQAIGKLASVPNWTPLYGVPLTSLVAQLIVTSGLTEPFKKAVDDGRVVTGMLEALEALPDEPSDPATMPAAFAMLGNLDAVARFSRSINDMLKAGREQGDIQALLNALSVDSLLSTMPFFQAALRLGQLTGDQEAADEILSAIKGPHRKRLMYPELRWAEYLLRDQDAFQACTREEIYELIVVHLGLYPAAGEDPKAGLFALFRTWQKEAGIQNPRFGFSGKKK